MLIHFYFISDLITYIKTLSSEKLKKIYTFLRRINYIGQMINVSI